MNGYNTKIIKSDSDGILYCSMLLKEGEVCGIPTETVYGLAANALNPQAINKIFEAKGRPSDNPLIVHISDFEMLYELVSEILPVAKKLADAFWPGPLTMVFPKKDIIPVQTSGGLDTVGVRMPAHKSALELIRKCGFPLAAPSANTSGMPSPTSACHVYNDLCGKIPAVLDGGECNIGVESTVISFENGGVRILRPGFVTAEELSDFCAVYVDKGIFEKVEASERVISPGMKYKHYSPKAKVFIVEGDTDKFCDFLRDKSSEKTAAVTFGDECGEIKIRKYRLGETAQIQAHRLFDILRELDRENIETAYFRCPDKTGVGLAVYNRLLRAAGFEVIIL